MIAAGVVVGSAVDARAHDGLVIAEDPSEEEAESDADDEPVVAERSRARPAPTVLPPLITSDPREPEAAFGLMGSVGGGWVAGADEWSEQLASARMKPITPFGGMFELQTFAQYEGFTLSAAVGATLIGPWDERRTASTLSAFGELGFDVLSDADWSLRPTIGLGYIESEVCVKGVPGAEPAAGGSPLQQVLNNPGMESCLSGGALALRVGLPMHIVSDSGDGLYGILGIRPAFTLALSQPSWGVEDSSLPRIAGPGPMYVGFSLTVDLGLSVGLGGKRTMP